MKDMPPLEFCTKYNACINGTQFARQFEKMSDCYAALTKNEARFDSLPWLFWIHSLPDIRNEDEKAPWRFVSWCLDRVRRYLPEPAIQSAIEALKDYAYGKITRAQFYTIWEKSDETDKQWIFWSIYYEPSLMRDIAYFACHTYALEHVKQHPQLTYAEVYEQELRRQLSYFKKNGNIFKEEV